MCVGRFWEREGRRNEREREKEREGERGGGWGIEAMALRYIRPAECMGGKK